MNPMTLTFSNRPPLRCARRSPRPGPWLAMAALVLLCVFLDCGRRATAQIQADAAPTTTSGLSIFYVPFEDMHRAPGYSGEGAYLPLDELLRLASAAGSAETATSGVSVFCKSVDLSGNVDDAVRLKGRLEFDARDDRWSAALVDDGTLPWTRQSVTTGTKAFLARVNGRTYLCARGPTSGTLDAEALVPLRFEDGSCAVSFGRFFSPLPARYHAG